MKNGKKNALRHVTDKLEILDPAVLNDYYDEQRKWGFHTRLISGMSLGTRIGEARIERGLTQTELANAIGTVYQRVHEWERDWRNPSDKYLMKIAEVLDVGFDWLKYGDYYDEPYEHYYSYNYGTDEEGQYEKRKMDLTTAAETLSVLTNDTLGHVATLLRLLYFSDLIDNYPGFEESLDYTVFQSYLDDENVKESLEYIKNKIMDKNGSK